MFFAIDRFEGGLAILEDDDERMHQVDRSLIPPEAKESDVLRLENDVYVVDAEETTRRREAVRRLQERLRRKQ